MAFQLMFVLLLFTRYFVLNTCAEIEIDRKTLYVSKDLPIGQPKTIVVNAESGSDLSNNERHKREVSSTSVDNTTEKVKTKTNKVIDVDIYVPRDNCNKNH